LITLPSGCWINIKNSNKHKTACIMINDTGRFR
jgi:hypothetical protein